MSKLLKRVCLTQAELAHIMRDKYPACSETSISLAERSDRSGVTYTEAFEADTLQMCGIEKKPEMRKNPCHLTIWISKEEKTYLSEKGNIGEYIRNLIAADMFHAEKEKPQTLADVHG